MNSQDASGHMWASLRPDEKLIPCPAVLHVVHELVQIDAGNPKVRSERVRSRTS